MLLEYHSWFKKYHSYSTHYKVDTLVWELIGRLVIFSLNVFTNAIVVYDVMCRCKMFEALELRTSMGCCNLYVQVINVPHSWWYITYLIETPCSYIELRLHIWGPVLTHDHIDIIKFNIPIVHACTNKWYIEIASVYPVCTTHFDVNTNRNCGFQNMACCYLILHHLVGIHVFPVIDTDMYLLPRWSNYNMIRVCKKLMVQWISRIITPLTSKWARWCLKSLASRLFTQSFIQTQI